MCKISENSISKIWPRNSTFFTLYQLEKAKNQSRFNPRLSSLSGKIEFSDPMQVSNVKLYQKRKWIRYCVPNMMSLDLRTITNRWRASHSTCNYLSYKLLALKCWTEHQPFLWNQNTKEKKFSIVAFRAATVASQCSENRLSESSQID